jgi:hypothetical protein
MTPAALASYTPLIRNSSNNLGITLVSTLSARPICLIVGGLPLTSSRPGGSAWAIRHSMRNHRPCAASEHWLRPGSVSQSSHQNFAQRRRVIETAPTIVRCRDHKNRRIGPLELCEARGIGGCIAARRNSCTAEVCRHRSAASATLASRPTRPPSSAGGSSERLFPGRFDFVER